VLGRHSPGECARGEADETAGRENLERPRSLPDQVRGRLEARGRADASARQERDSGRVDEPPDRLGDVARLLVLGEQAGERAAECRVKRGEEER
jgi:hypothetical protein